MAAHSASTQFKTVNRLWQRRCLHGTGAGVPSSFPSSASSSNSTPADLPPTTTNTNAGISPIALNTTGLYPFESMSVADLLADQRVLVCGAGGTGCEVLHTLPLLGVRDITTVDLDTVDLTNLNRQFLFRDDDIGEPKATAAARSIMGRLQHHFPDLNVVGEKCKVQDKDIPFYSQFGFVIMCFDSMEARQWISATLAGIVKWTIVSSATTSTATASAAAPSSSPTTASTAPSSSSSPPRKRVRYEPPEDGFVIPIMDTGSEALACHYTLTTHGTTACPECDGITNQKGPPPMCTLETVPRRPEHCINYVQFKTWEDHQPFGPGVKLDGDDLDHVAWVMEQAKERQAQFHLPGQITISNTQGVIKNSIPTIGFTNALCCGAALSCLVKQLLGNGGVSSSTTEYDGSSPEEDAAADDAPGDGSAINPNADTRGTLFNYSGTSGGSSTLSSQKPNPFCHRCAAVRHVCVHLGNSPTVTDLVKALRSHHDTASYLISEGKTNGYIQVQYYNKQSSLISFSLCSDGGNDSNYAEQQEQLLADWLSVEVSYKPSERSHSVFALINAKLRFILMLE